MSDNRRVVRDTKRGRIAMNTAVEKSAHFLNELARHHHRGRGDTWTAARDRAAREAGIERSYAKRIWDRWQTMRDVSGEAFMRLEAAYEAICKSNEDAADRYAAERAALRGSNETIAHQSRAKGIPENDARH